MNGQLRRNAEWLRRWAGWMVVMSSVSLGGCASMYVDGNLPETPRSEFRMPEKPQAVQLAFEFRTSGTANTRATDYLKGKVLAQVQESGLFSSVSDRPVQGGALLTITVNNVALKDDAFAKGFIAGLTFGLAGSTVADGYEGNLRYLPPSSGRAALDHGAKHVIYTSIGTGSPPVGALKTASGEEAVTLMLKQLLGRLLGNLSKDPGFPTGQPTGNSTEAAKQL